MSGSPIRRALAGARWEGVETMRYKEAGSAPFRDITRQVLFGGADLRCEWRYFEIAPNGYSTLERHEHAHAVMILRGHGACLVGDRVYPVAEHDLVSVPPLTWHQFRAAADAPLGFLCLVDKERDRPQLPDANELAALRRDPEVGAFIRTGSDSDSDR
jgi:quercetin dioxygenase-like cupin family protein